MLLPVELFRIYGEAFYLENMPLIGALYFMTLMISVFIFQLLNRSKNSYIALLFNCHQRSNRSFNFRGSIVPICARCSGIIVGIVLSTLIKIPKEMYLYTLLLLIPLVVDGFLQLKTDYVSNNVKRFVSGILFALPLTIMYSTGVYLVIKILLLLNN
jgi:uncharacterized membrane protein